MDKPETEILVHIAAPARALDDSRYRTLAAAYLAFEPRSRTSITFVAQGCTEENGSVDVHQSNPDLGSIHSPILSFRSAINNFDSPPLRRAVDGCMGTLQLSWKAPPSIIQDSVPDNNLAFTRYCTPTRLLSHYTSGFDSTQMETSPIHQAKQSPVSAISPQHKKHPIQDDEDRQHQTLEVDGERAVISVSPSADKPCSQWRTTPTPLDESRIVSSYPSQQLEPVSSHRSESDPPVSKRPRTSRDPAPGKPTTKNASDMGPRPRRANSVRWQALDTLEILSPPPITGQRELRPEDMITDVLASLAQKLNLEKRFRPETQTRDLRPFERGYWLVDCTSWEPELKKSAWAFLSDYLSKGCAGWGTSCKRDQDFLWIRLYCWGCVVGHLYLVLYLISKRRVLYTGTSWIGGDGKPVVVMGPRQGIK